MKVAFYAPMKSPAHPIPSGDRRMGQLIMSALRGAGFDPELISEFRSFEKNGDLSQQLSIRKSAEAETAKIISHCKDLPVKDRPKLWFTYHIYHKAPDWIGPAVSNALPIVSRKPATRQSNVPENGPKGMLRRLLQSRWLIKFFI